jgi:CheY-like chemotaxis protein
MSMVLVVDDVPSTRNLVSAAVVQAGHQLLEAATGDDAIALAANQPIDVLVLNWSTPGLDAAIAAFHGRIPFLAVSERSSDESPALAAGATAFLSLPFGVAHLGDAIARTTESLLRPASP